MSRRLRTTVPITRGQREPGVPDMALVRSRDQSLKERQKQNFDKRHRSATLPSLAPGDTVWVPGRDSEAVVGEEVAPRSYNVTTASGAQVRRNRRDLIAIPADAASSDPSVVQTDTSIQPNQTTPVSEEESQNSATTEEQPCTQEKQPPNRYDPSWT